MSEHPHSIGWFSKERKEIFNFVRRLKISIEAKKRLLLVIAQVKAGKKEIVECIKLEYPDCKACYLTSLNRKDVKNQQVELARYGIETYVVNSEAIIEQIIEDVNDNLKKGYKTIFFWDECDYGSAKNQKLNKLFAPFIDTDQIIHVLISATPQETLFSSLIERPDFTSLTFVPPEEYKGAQYFLDANLVFTPKPFLQKVADTTELQFSPHAFEVMRESYTISRNIGATRVTGKLFSLINTTDLERSLTLHFYEGFQGRPFKVQLIDATSSLNWEDPIIRRGYTCQPLEYNWLFIFNQTCTRGTDLKGWHPNIAFWHDARSCSSCNLNTLLQAILRPAHYSNCYMSKKIVDGKEYSASSTPQAIRLYVDKAAVKAATGDYTDYGKAKGKAPTRTTVPRISAKYESYESTNYELLKPHFDTIKQTFPPITSFPKKGDFYTPLQKLGINAVDRALDVWPYDNAKNLKCQLNRLHQYYIIPSYKDLDRPDSLVWVITRKLTDQVKGKMPFKATMKSMYEN